MTSCPSDGELARAVGADPDPRLAQHLAACASCRTSWQATHDAIALAREVAAPAPSAARREEVRTAILAARVGRRSPPRAHFVVAGVAAAAVVAVVVFARSGDGDAAEPVAVVAHGAVHADPGARFTTSQPPDEIVRLVDGSLDIEVSPLALGERFRVIVGDAEVEVRGTRFVVTARADHLDAVAVAHGVVEVRVAGSAPLRLVAGETWRARVATAVVPPQPPVVDRPPPPRPRPAIARTVEPPEPIAPIGPIGPVAPIAPIAPPHVPPAAELAYGDGWDAMRSRDFTRAAAAFARVVALGGALVEDATYWHAVALARGGSRDAAIVAFRGYLDTYASSPRAGEASAMLGWLLVDARQLAEAARRFRAAANNPNPAVRASARNGLTALAR